MSKSHKCHNLLFCKWVKEWVDEAKEKGWQSYHTYKKALKSLEKFPMPLKSGSECKILEGFGPKICLQIDKKLKEYADCFGLSIGEALEEGNTALISEQSKSKHKSSQINNAVPAADLNTAPVDNGKVKEKRKNLNLSVKGEFMPRYRSGGYALLFTLFKHWQINGNGSHMSKSDLMREAQLHCDSSFFMPANNNSHYTAWSSMGSLIQKQLVLKFSNPGKYSITDKGVDLTQRMIEAVRESGLDVGASSSHSKSLTQSSSSSKLSQHDVGASSSNSKSLTQSSSSSKLSQHNVGVSSSHSKSLTQSSSSSSKLSQHNVGVSSSNPKSLTQTSSSSSISQLEIPSTSSSNASQLSTSSKSSHKRGLSNGYPPMSPESVNVAHETTSDEDEHLVPLSLSERMKRSLDSSPIRKSMKMTDREDIPSQIDTSVRVAPTTSLSTVKSNFVFSFCSDHHTRVNSKDEALVSIEEDFGVGFLITSCYESLLSSNCRYKLDLNGLEFAQPGFVYAFLHNENAPNCSNWEAEDIVTELPPPVSSQEPQQVEKSLLPVDAEHVKSGSVKLQEVANPGEEKPNVLHIFPHEEYSISLCVDNREHFGMGKVKQMLLPALLRNKVICDVRPLPIGDFLWIAKTADGREAVLDYVVERKRIDDLASSITDGRFTEQKFRLKRTGIRRVIYLIEMSGFALGNLSLPMDRLNQSIANSQIIDNCDVKMVRNAEDTFSYLSLMTKKIQQIYARKTLSVVDFFPIDRRECGDVALDYECFNNSSQKSPALSVKEMFAKCLLQLKFMTAEKTLAILQHYPTPRSLMSAYDALPTTKQKESLLADIVYKANPKKSIGAMMSRSVFYSYNNK